MGAGSSVSWKETRDVLMNEFLNVNLNGITSHAMGYHKPSSTSNGSSDQFQPLRIPETEPYRGDSATMQSAFSNSMLNGMQS